MKTASLLLATCAALVAPVPPVSGPSSRMGTVIESGLEQPKRNSSDVHRAVGNMESWLTDLRSQTQFNSATGRSAGNLWMEVNQLKRGGEDVRRIEWYVSELEDSLRNTQQDTPSRRHILNNLELEMQNLRRRAR